METANLNYRPVVLAVAVATAGVLPAFLTGGLAVQVRGELALVALLAVLAGRRMVLSDRTAIPADGAAIPEVADR